MAQKGDTPEQDKNGLYGTYNLTDRHYAGFRRFISHWRNTTAIRILVAVIITVTIGIGLFSSLDSQYKEDSKLLNNGSHIVATVTKKSRDYDDHSEYYQYMVQYVFSLPDGEALKGDGEISHHNWKQLREGRPIEIVFDPTDPSHNLPVLVIRGFFWESYYYTIFLSIFVFIIVSCVLFALPPLIIRLVHKIYDK